MSRISLFIKVVFCLLATSYVANGQTASATAGCAELKVEFTAPDAPSYYWVFGDGASSVSSLQNPVHSYIQDGDYVAQLFDQQNGTQIGDDIQITVYPAIEIDIVADVREGCAPLEVSFSSTIVKHPDIDIDDIVWTFGDGNSASGQNTTYTYTENGIYTVSIKVIAAQSIKCDEPVIFEDFISLEGERVTFNINQTSTCDVPSDFIFLNTSDVVPGSTLSWDFDNGQTRTGEGPHTINYSAAGVYAPSLTITSPSGCESSLRRTISLGAPMITPTYPDTICRGAEVVLGQSTVASDFLWDFSGTSIDSSFSPVISEEKRPNVLFTEPGLQTFTLTATAPDGCESTTTLDVFVLQPDADYALAPAVTCLDPVLIEYIANDPNHSIYSFNSNYIDGGPDTESDLPNGGSLYELPERDPFYVNSVDSVKTRLIVTSAQGCMDTSFLSFALQSPEAFFLPDIVKGCIPFEVNFSDQSFSDFQIIDRFWDYGDGQQAQFGANDTVTSHVFTTTGFHDVTLTITDDAGCKDQSRAVRIIAIDKDTIPAVGDGVPCPEIALCVGDTLDGFVNADQVNLNIHLESDEGRFDHCWTEQRFAHAYMYPGSYPLDFTFEFLTIYIDSVITGCVVEVEGSRSKIDYFIDCADPYVVDFSSENSINADDYAWFIEDQLISNDSAFVHTFEERGEYMVYLETAQNTTRCSHRDSVLIHITEIKAGINVPERSCASSATPLDASSSQDVHDLCRAGYIWQFENQRPREVDREVLNHTLLPGFQEVTLIVEDINGCKDTLSANTTAYDLQADFTTDDLICLPTELDLNNLSTGDTTLMSYDWDFGAGTSSQENPTYVFDVDDYDQTLMGDSITVTLAVEDVIGCRDTSEFIIETYDVLSDFTMDNGPVICQDEVINFEATDFTSGGSFLTYDWDFDDNGSSTVSNPSITFTESGEQLITLTFTEDGTGCQGTLDTLVDVIPTPEAGFISDQDDTEFICFPEQIQFTNTSDIGNNGVLFWDFGNGSESSIPNPLIPFDKGTYEVQMIIFTPEGCSDTISQEYTLVGPEGNFSVDKTDVCPGEEITFVLNDPVDVLTYTWDFGDGTQVNDQSPVTHTYDPSVNLDVFTPTLILRSDGDGCELVQDIPINVSSITADFTDSTGVCPGQVTLFSTFENPQSIEWNIDGQIITGDSNPSVNIMSDSSTVQVVLLVTDANGCAVQRSAKIDNPMDLTGSRILFPNVFSPNGDANNPVFNIVYDDMEITSDVVVTDFRVYNRWGQLLYNNDNPSIGWDGRYKGETVPPDVYAYFIEVTIDGCMSLNKKGNVTVIK